MRQALVVGNWKMHGSRASVDDLLGDLVQGSRTPDTEVVVCPAYVYLAQAQALCISTTISVGAQDCSHLQSGAFTGEVAPTMLSDL